MTNSLWMCSATLLHVCSRRTRDTSVSWPAWCRRRRTNSPKASWWVHVNPVIAVTVFSPRPPWITAALNIQTQQTAETLSRVSISHVEGRTGAHRAATKSLLPLVKLQKMTLTLVKFFNCPHLCDDFCSFHKNFVHYFSGIFCDLGFFLFQGPRLELDEVRNVVD